jgi:cyclic-di-GMP phosphodiesterase, flagellum assembly factor TipF
LTRQSVKLMMNADVADARRIDPGLAPARMPMFRLTELFVAVGMLLIAGALGTASVLALGLPRTEGAVVALAAFTVLVLYYLAATRARERREAARQIVDLSRGIADLSRQVGQQEQRLAALAGGSEAAIQNLSALHQPLAAEVAELRTVVGQLTGAIGGAEEILASAPASVRPAPAAAGPDGARATGVSASDRPVSSEANAALVAHIRQAIQSGSVDTYVQPIVTLPQRKVACYEATPRLRGASSTQAAPSDFPETAEGAGLAGELDLLMAFRCVRVARRINSGHENIAIFCNLARPTLSERETFARIADFMEANRALAPLLVFEFALASWRALRAREQEALSTLASFGFRFCLDRVTDLRLDPLELAERSCAYVKAPAALLLDQRGAGRPADLASELARVGVKMIAEKVEAEATVMDLLDLDVRYAQGGLFSPPRPVRSEVTVDGADPAILPAAASRVSH